MKSPSRLYIWPLAGLVMTIVLSASVQAATDAGESPCQARHLAMHFDGRDGLYDGMSQRGGFLVLHNNGAHTCELDEFPALGFEGADGQRLAVGRRMPRGMNPGPVVLPVKVAPGAEVATLLHWVSGDVYPGHNCVTTATAFLELGDDVLRMPFDLPMCAAASSTEFFDQAPLGGVIDNTE